MAPALVASLAAAVLGAAASLVFCRVKLSWRATALEALFGTLGARSGVSPCEFLPFFGLRPKLRVALMIFSIARICRTFHDSTTALPLHPLFYRSPIHPVDAPVNMSSTAHEVALDRKSFGTTIHVPGARTVEAVIAL